MKETIKSISIILLGLILAYKQFELHSAKSELAAATVPTLHEPPQWWSRETNKSGNCINIQKRSKKEWQNYCQNRKEAWNILTPYERHLLELGRKEATKPYIHTTTHLYDSFLKALDELRKIQVEESKNSL